MIGKSECSKAAAREEFVAHSRYSLKANKSQKKFKAKRSRKGFSLGVDESQITVIFYDESVRGNALRDLRRLRSLNHLGFVKPYFIAENGSGFVVVTERIPERAKSWFRKPQNWVWKYNVSRNEVLGLG